VFQQLRSSITRPRREFFVTAYVLRREKGVAQWNGSGHGALPTDWRERGRHLALASPAACPLRHVPPSPSASVLKQHRAVCSAVHGNRPGPLIGRGKRKKSERRTGPRLAVSDASGVASGGQDDAGIRGFRSALTRAAHPISSHHTPALSLVSLSGSRFLFPSSASAPSSSSAVAAAAAAAA
jgi:hypothetical protein